MLILPLSTRGKIILKTSMLYIKNLKDISSMQSNKETRSYWTMSSLNWTSWMNYLWLQNFISSMQWI